mmetsp:Transcript_46962/g.93483  ORF Transcript_46962/g.93483 Transcript_46962/m.93483 type:complete len:410 (+) Transcript_46962:64-1293(+)
MLSELVSALQGNWENATSRTTEIYEVHGNNVTRSRLHTGEVTTFKGYLRPDYTGTRLQWGPKGRFVMQVNAWGYCLEEVTWVLNEITDGASAALARGQHRGWRWRRLATESFSSNGISSGSGGGWIQPLCPVDDNRSWEEPLMNCHRGLDSSPVSWQMSSSTARTLRPSVDYEQKWRSREYGGEAKMLRLKERQKRAAMRLQDQQQGSSGGQVVQQWEDGQSSTDSLAGTSVNAGGRARCKPCLFFHRAEGCKDGQECYFCHGCPECLFFDNRCPAKTTVSQSKTIPPDVDAVGPKEAQDGWIVWQPFPTDKPHAEAPSPATSAVAETQDTAEHVADVQRARKYLQTMAHKGQASKGIDVLRAYAKKGYLSLEHAECAIAHFDRAIAQIAQAASVLAVHDDDLGLRILQ